MPTPLLPTSTPQGSDIDVALLKALVQNQRASAAYQFTAKGQFQAGEGLREGRIIPPPTIPTGEYRVPAIDDQYNQFFINPAGLALPVRNLGVAALAADVALNVDTFVWVDLASITVTPLEVSQQLRLRGRFSGNFNRGSIRVLSSANIEVAKYRMPGTTGDILLGLVPFDFTVQASASSAPPLLFKAGANTNAQTFKIQAQFELAGGGRKILKDSFFWIETTPTGNIDYPKEGTSQDFTGSDWTDSVKVELTPKRSDSLIILSHVAPDPDGTDARLVKNDAPYTGWTLADSSRDIYIDRLTSNAAVSYAIQRRNSSNTGADDRLTVSDF